MSDETKVAVGAAGRDALGAQEAIWSCKIGETDRALLPSGSDGPMRDAIAAAFYALTGHPPHFLFSGWGAELTEPERAVVENREPKEIGAAGVAPPQAPDRRQSQRRSEANTARSEAGPERRSFTERRVAAGVAPSVTWYPCACGAEHDTPTCPFGVAEDAVRLPHDSQCEAELTSHGYTECRCEERAAHAVRPAPLDVFLIREDGRLRQVSLGEAAKFYHRIARQISHRSDSEADLIGLLATNLDLARSQAVERERASAARLENLAESMTAGTAFEGAREELEPGDPRLAATSDGSAQPMLECDESTTGVHQWADSLRFPSARVCLGCGARGVSAAPTVPPSEDHEFRVGEIHRRLMKRANEVGLSVALEEAAEEIVEAAPAVPRDVCRDGHQVERASGRCIHCGLHCDQINRLASSNSRKLNDAIRVLQEASRDDLAQAVMRLETECIAQGRAAPEAHPGAALETEVWFHNLTKSVRELVNRCASRQIRHHLLAAIDEAERRLRAQARHTP